MVRLWLAPRRKSLLTHHDPEAAAPAFGKAHANDFQIGREIFQALVRSGMKSQRGRNQVDERSRLLQGDAGKIAVTRDFSALQLAPDAQPVVSGLQWQV